MTGVIIMSNTQAAVSPAIQERIEALDKLIKKHPTNIPVREAAKFLGIGDNGLKQAIKAGTVPFALSWQTPVFRRNHECAKQRQYRISSLAFAGWVLCGLKIDNNNAPD